MVAPRAIEEGTDVAEHQLTTLREGGHFFEGPRWHDGRWWVSDFYAGTVSTVTVDGQSETLVELDDQPSGLGWLPDGRLLLVSMGDRRVLRREEDGTLEVHADLSEHVVDKANDMVVDEEGRAWVGGFGFDLMAGEDPAPASLLRVDPDGTVHVAATDLLFPNGSVILPDGETLIVGETVGCRSTAFTIGPDGALSDRRVWAQLAPTPKMGTFEEVLSQVQVAPDGCCLDAEEHLWIADALGGRVIRVAQGGKVVDQVATPEGLGAFACMLGGESGRTLLICAAPDFAEHARREATEAVLLTTEVEVPRAGRP